MGEEVNFVVEPLDHPHITDLLTAFGRIYANGGVILRSFRATDPTASGRASRSDFGGIEHTCRTFVTCPSVVSTLPELEIQLPLERPPEFRWMSAFGVEGDLTHMLLTGGAYERFRGTVDEARTLSRRFMEAIFGEELHRVGWAGGSTTPWTPWFYDIAWDATFVLHDQRAKGFVLLCLTDTD